MIKLSFPLHFVEKLNAMQERRLKVKRLGVYYGEARVLYTLTYLTEDQAFDAVLAKYGL